jgi:hypothetical protein
MAYLRYYLILLLWPSIADAQHSGPIRAGLTETLRYQIEELEAEYSIELILDNPGLPIRAQNNYLVEGLNATPAQVQKYLPTLLAEWRLYPPKEDTRESIFFQSDLLLPRPTNAGSASRIPVDCRWRFRN